MIDIKWEWISRGSTEILYTGTFCETKWRLLNGSFSKILISHNILYIAHVYVQNILKYKKQWIQEPLPL